MESKRCCTAHRSANGNHEKGDESLPIVVPGPDNLKTRRRQKQERLDFQESSVWQSQMVVLVNPQVVGTVWQHSDGRLLVIPISSSYLLVSIGIDRALLLLLRTCKRIHHQSLPSFSLIHRMNLWHLVYQPLRWDIKPTEEGGLHLAVKTLVKSLHVGSNRSIRVDLTLVRFSVLGQRAPRA